MNTLFIERGSPWENGYIDSFNGKLRDELLNWEIFTTLDEASILIEEWRKEYKHVRPHSALSYQPPAPEAIIPLTLTSEVVPLPGAGQLEGSVFWTGLAAFNLDRDPRLAYFTLGLVNLGLLVPSAPAYVGIFQSCNVLAFSFFGLPKNVALAYSITIHALMVLPITLLGLLFINFYGMSLWRFHKTKVKEI